MQTFCRLQKKYLTNNIAFLFSPFLFSLPPSLLNVLPRLLVVLAIHLLGIVVFRTPYVGRHSRNGCLFDLLLLDQSY